MYSSCHSINPPTHLHNLKLGCLLETWNLTICPHTSIAYIKGGVSVIYEIRSKYNLTLRLFYKETLFLSLSYFLLEQINGFQSGYPHNPFSCVAHTSRLSPAHIHQPTSRSDSGNRPSSGPSVSWSEILMCL